MKRSPKAPRHLRVRAGWALCAHLHDEGHSSSSEAAGGPGNGGGDLSTASWHSPATRWGRNARTASPRASGSSWAGSPSVTSLRGNGEANRLPYRGPVRGTRGPVLTRRFEEGAGSESLPPRTGSGALGARSSNATRSGRRPMSTGRRSREAVFRVGQLLLHVLDRRPAAESMLA